MKADFGYVIAQYGIVPLVILLIGAMVLIAVGENLTIIIILAFFITYLCVKGFLLL